MSKDVAIVDIGDTFRSDLSCTRHEMCLIREMVDVNGDRVVATRVRELRNEVYPDDFPRLRRDFLRLQVRVWVA